MSESASPAGPTPVELLAAWHYVAARYPRTALRRAPLLEREHGGRLYVKYENHGPVRSFKARAALYRLSLLQGEARQRGVVTASTGNHGQGVAYAGGLLGVPATIVVPEGSPPLKTDNIRFLGGDLRVIGRSLAESERAARDIAAGEGRLFIEDGDDAGLMAGAGTIAWEILDELPEAGAILVPVGGGNLIAGVALVAKRLRPDIRIFGIQSEAAPAVQRSFAAGHAVEAPCTTFAGGLATDHPGAMAFAVLRRLVDDIVLVSEDELRAGIVTVLRTTGQVAEGAGAAAFAALPRLMPRLAGPAVLLLTGGNLPIEELTTLLCRA
jgi:threonine dehydratase